MLRLALGAVVVAWTSAAFATDISGTWSGTLSGTENCPSQPPRPFTDNITVTITQSGSTFTGTGTSNDSGGSTATFAIINGSISSGSFSADIASTSTSEGIPFDGFLSGTVSGDQLTITYLFAQDIGPPNCSWTESGTLNRVTGNVISENTTSSTLIAQNPAQLTSEVNSITLDVGHHINNFLRGIFQPQLTANGFMLGQGTGLAAGEGGTRYGAWGSYAYSDFENDFAATAFDGNRHNVLAGADFSPWERTVFGVAFGYENSDIDTGFNRGNMDSEGFSFAPYFGALLTDTWSLDFNFGYTTIDIDQYRTAGATRVTSSPDAHRWFGTFNVNGLTTYGNWILGAKIGTMYAQQRVDDFTESDGTRVAELKSEVGQWNVGGNVAYSWGSFEPFASLVYENDFNSTEITVAGGGPQPANDEDDFLFGLGVRYYSRNGITGNIEWNKRFDRADFDEDTISATIRADF
jgi:hypothetical protein